jgi:hypothetical protein
MDTLMPKQAFIEHSATDRHPIADYINSDLISTFSISSETSGHCIIFRPQFHIALQSRSERSELAVSPKSRPCLSRASMSLPCASDGSQAASRPDTTCSLLALSEFPIQRGFRFAVGSHAQSLSGLALTAASKSSILLADFIRIR